MMARVEMQMEVNGVHLGDYVRETCCDKLAAAMQGGTDAERWGNLVDTTFHGLRFRINTTEELATPDFCPWCGTKNDGSCLKERG